MDLGHLSAVRNRLTVAGKARSIGVDHYGIAKDHSDYPFVPTDGDGLPCFVSPELRERQAAWDLHGVLVLGSQRQCRYQRESNKHGYAGTLLFHANPLCLSYV